MLHGITVNLVGMLENYSEKLNSVFESMVVEKLNPRIEGVVKSFKCVVSKTERRKFNNDYVIRVIRFKHLVENELGLTPYISCISHGSDIIYYDQNVENTEEWPMTIEATKQKAINYLSKHLFELKGEVEDDDIDLDTIFNETFGDLN